MRILLAAVLAAVSLPLASAPAYADSNLGGYDATADAAVVRVAIHEPGVPIPADPQVDATVGYARSTTATGPISRALASYVWPGDAVGDGLGTLAGNESVNYPVSTNSKYPATTTAPAKNAVQINDGNGMSTSADGTRTQSTVVGAGIGNGVFGAGQGLCQLFGSCATAEPPKVVFPDPLAAVATMENFKSQSTVELGANAVTATAHASASGMKILGGLITLDGLDMVSSVTADGSKATPTGSSRFAGLKVLGQAVDLGDSVNLAGNSSAIPKVPVDLAALGIKITYLDSAKASSGDGAGSLGAQGLTIVVDASVLGKALNAGSLSNALSPLLDQIPQAGPLLGSLLQMGSKITITIGDVRTKASAVPAYGGEDGGDAGTVVAPAAGGDSPNAGPASATDVPLGAGDLGAALPGAPEVPVSGTPMPSPEIAPTGSPFTLPGLSQFPTLLLLGTLALAGVLGWLFRGVGAWMLAGGACSAGHSIGVPNLRKV